MLSTYLENKLNEHITGKTSYTMPTVYLTLMTVLPAKDGTGGTEMAVTRQTTTWNSSSGGTITNNGAVTFTGIPAGNVVGVAAYDASTSGNFLWCNEIEQVATNEAITLVGGLANLANPNISSVVVKNSAETVTYTEGTDYVVQYDTGTICRLSGSAFTSTATLHVTYQYPIVRTMNAGDNWTFASGQLGHSFKTWK